MSPITWHQDLKVTLTKVEGKGNFILWPNGRQQKTKLKRTTFTMFKPWHSGHIPARTSTLLSASDGEFILQFCSVILYSRKHCLINTSYGSSTALISDGTKPLISVPRHLGCSKPCIFRWVSAGEMWLHRWRTGVMYSLRRPIDLCMYNMYIVLRYFGDFDLKTSKLFETMYISVG